MQKLQSSIVYPEVKLLDVLYAFWKGIKPQKWSLFIQILSVTLANILAVIIPLFYKKFFDIIVSGGDKLAVAQKLFEIIVYVAIFNVVYWLFYRIANLANNYYQPKIMARLRQQAYDYLQGHSYSFFSDNFIGSLVQKVNRFARAFEDLSDDFTWNLLPLLVKVISIFIVVLFINKLIALVIFIWVAVFLIFNIIFSRWKLKYDIKTAEMDSKTTGYLADTLTNHNTVQLFSGLKHESEGFKGVTNEQARITIFTWNLNKIIEAVQILLGIVVEFVLFFMAIKYWQRGLITIGVFVLIQTYIIQIIDQFWGLTKIVRNLYRAYADAKEMVEVLLLPHEIKDVPDARDLLVDRGQIEFKDLDFGFNQTRKILENINLVIKPSEKVALIGPSGAGKTTFVRLLLRLYTPTSGKILIDDQDILQVKQDDLRKNIAMVPQDTVLFHRTLAENIGYGKKDASIDEIKKAAELAHCDEFINALPHGLETYVGERGIKLSGGERQRVAIARAILKNAPILILDEATSSLDSHSELLIQDALDNLMKGKTTIVIAHRLSTVRKMDRIIVVDNGKIIEQGSHDELLSQKDSLYKKLWSLQVGGFLKEEDDEEVIESKDIEFSSEVKEESLEEPPREPSEVKKE